VRIKRIDKAREALMMEIAMRGGLRAKSETFGHRSRDSMALRGGMVVKSGEAVEAYHMTESSIGIVSV
jgi:hypothetical protein